jgi:hypothetical protein
MHILPYKQRRSLKHRSSGEQALKWVNIVVAGVQLACFIIVITQINSGARLTFDNDMWNDDPIALTVSLQAKLSNCSSTQTIELSGFTGIPATFSEDNFFYYMAYMMREIKFAVVVNAFATVLGWVNKVLFNLNFYETRHKHIILRKDILTTLEIMFLVFGILATNDASGWAGYLTEHLKHCGLVEKSYLPYVPPLVAFFVCQSITLAMHVLCMAAHVYNAYNEKIALAPIGLDPMSVDDNGDGVIEEIDADGNVVADARHPARVAQERNQQRERDGARQMQHLGGGDEDDLPDGALPPPREGSPRRGRRDRRGDAADEQY